MGAAIYNAKSNTIQKFKLPQETTIFEAEAVGIIKALEMIKSNNIKKAIICTDSLSNIKALQACEIASKTPEVTLDIKSLYSRLKSNGIQIIIAWTPGHIGIKGNEIADMAANQARKEGKIIGIDNEIRILHTKFKTQQWEKKQDKLTQEFKEKGIIYGKLRNINQKYYWFKNSNLNRSTITLINRIRSNHICTNEFLYKIKRSETPECPCGRAIQDLNHIFWDCELTRKETDELEKFLEENKNIKPPYEIRILSFSEDHEILKKITEFTFKIKEAIDLTHTKSE